MGTREIKVNVKINPDAVIKLAEKINADPRYIDTLAEKAHLARIRTGWIHPGPSSTYDAGYHDGVIETLIMILEDTVP